MPTQSSAGSITDDILWSDCPEELYLRRILQEQYQDDETIVDSILGQSTVAGIMSGDVNKSFQSDDQSDGKSWLDFSPLAGSVVTAPITPDDEMSPPFNEKKKAKESKLTNKVKSSRAAPPEEYEMMYENNHVPLGISPRFIDFDEESSTGSLRVTRIPDMVDMDDSYDEEATDIDATRGGLSTLSGDTFLRNIGLQTFQPDYDRTWVDVDEISYAKALEDSTGATSKSSKQDSRSDPTQDRPRVRPAPQATRASPRRDSEPICCCSRIIQIVTEDDRIFRRTVIFAVILIVLFVSLSVFALIRSDTLFISDTPESTSRPLASPVVTLSPSESTTWIDPIDENQESDIPVLDVTAPPSFSPVQNHDEDSSAHVPTAAPSISDPFRFVSSLVNERSPDSLKHFLNPESPQYQAFQWLISDLPNTIETSDERVLQRWTLAVLFYSLRGNDWTRNDGWLTESDVCNWFTSSSEEVCNDLGLLSRLELAQNNLQGLLPNELELLSSSLIEINLEDNEITGSISSSLGELGSLEILNLSSNKFSGVIPTELGRLSNLELLELASNDLSGTMPSEICNRTTQALDTLTVDCAQVSCTCCDSC